jgi:hypothetical protein
MAGDTEVALHPTKLGTDFEANPSTDVTTEWSLHTGTPVACPPKAPILCRLSAPRE